MTGGSCRDLRKYMNDPKVLQAFGKVLTGKSNYSPPIETKAPECPKCKTILCGDEKFCPECGTKIEKEKRD